MNTLECIITLNSLTLFEMLQIVEPSQSEWLKKLTAGRFDEFQQNPGKSIFYVDEIPLIAKNGSRVWVEATYRLVINDDTGEPEIVAVSRDITEKKVLEM